MVLAVYAVGSLLAGLVFGALALRATLLRQFMIATATLAVVTAPLPFLPQVWQIARRAVRRRAGLLTGADLRHGASSSGSCRAAG